MSCPIPGFMVPDLFRVPLSNLLCIKNKVLAATRLVLLAGATPARAPTVNVARVSHATMTTGGTSITVSPGTALLAASTGNAPLTIYMAGIITPPARIEKAACLTGQAAFFTGQGRRSSGIFRRSPTCILGERRPARPAPVLLVLTATPGACRAPASAAKQA